MKHFAIFEQANNGRIWSRLADVDGIVGNGATLAEARESLLVSIRLASEAGETLHRSPVIAVEEIDLAISA